MKGVTACSVAASRRISSAAASWPKARSNRSRSAPRSHHRPARRRGLFRQEPPRPAHRQLRHPGRQGVRLGQPHHADRRTGAQLPHLRVQDFRREVAAAGVAKLDRAHDRWRRLPERRWIRIVFRLSRVIRGDIRVGLTRCRGQTCCGWHFLVEFCSTGTDGSVLGNVSLLILLYDCAGVEEKAFTAESIREA